MADPAEDLVGLAAESSGLTAAIRGVEHVGNGATREADLERVVVREGLLEREPRLLLRLAPAALLEEEPRARAADRRDALRLAAVLRDLERELQRRERLGRLA